MRIDQFVQNNKIFDSIKGLDKKEEKTDVSFLDTLKDKLNEVNDKQIKADETTEAFVNGEGTDIHEVMLSTEEAKMSLELAVQVRNKIVEAYQEINRMQL